MFKNTILKDTTTTTTTVLGFGKLSPALLYAVKKGLQLFGEFFIGGVGVTLELLENKG
jgi:hypothetical protein